MTDTYDTDIVAWSEQQAEALRRRAANAIDWDNVAEEIEDVGRSETNATLSQIVNVLRHRIYLAGWPDSASQRRWRSELREFERQLRQHYAPSMTGTGKVTNAVVAALYPDAVEYALAHMNEPPTMPLPQDCPWTLDALLGLPAAGEAR
jgi:Domain of unknown function DUF29